MITVGRGFRGFVSPNPALACIEHEVREKDGRSADLRREIQAELTALNRRELAEERSRYGGLWKSLETGFGNFFSEVENRVAEQMVELSVKIAEIIIKHELPDKTMVKNVIRETLTSIMDFKGANVRVHPSDAEWLEQVQNENPPGRLAANMRIVPDGSLGRGDVLIESRNGYFDARIEERLKILQKRLVERYRTAHAERAES